MGLLLPFGVLIRMNKWINNVLYLGKEIATVSKENKKKIMEQFGPILTRGGFATV